MVRPGRSWYGLTTYSMLDMVGVSVSRLATWTAAQSHSPSTRQGDDNVTGHSPEARSAFSALGDRAETAHPVDKGATDPHTPERIEAAKTKTFA